MTKHLVTYTARTDRGLAQGVAEIATDRARPTRRDCVEQIPGFVTGQHLALAPLYLLRYETARGRVERRLTASAVERIGAMVNRVADRGNAWNIEVIDAAGGDVTFDFACFRI